jgi:hypothetical protein
VACWPMQVVIEPVYDLSPSEGGDCGWKRKVVRPVSNSLQVREFVGEVISSRECPTPASGSKTS